MDPGDLAEWLLKATIGIVVTTALGGVVLQAAADLDPGTKSTIVAGLAMMAIWTLYQIASKTAG